MKCWFLLCCFVLIAGCTDESETPLGPEASFRIDAMRAAFDQGDLQRALDLADSAAIVTSEAAEIDYVRGQVYSTLRQYEKADAAFARALGLDSTYPGLWYRRGHNAFLQRKYREAHSYYVMDREVLAGASEKPADDDLATITAQIGRTYAMLGSVDSARVAYEEALGADSTLAVAHSWLSELLENEGHDEEALPHAMQALRANPLEIEYGYRVGALLFRLGRAGEAIPYLTTVAQRWPGHEGAAFNLGRALQVEGHMEEARFYLERVEQIRTWQNEAMMAERGVETYPDDPARWIDLAGYMMKMGYFDRAESALQAAHALKPGDLSLLSDLANLAFARGDSATAVRRYTELLAEDTTFTDGWLNLGVMHAMMGDQAAAREAWNNVLRQNPDDADARAYLEQLDHQQKDR